MVLAVAFLLEDNVTDHTSKIVMEAVTTKAETILALKSISLQLETMTSSLSSIVDKLAATPTSQTAPQHLDAHPTCADVVSSGSPLDSQPILAQFNPNILPQKTCMQQCLLCNARMVLVEVDASCANAPQNCLPTGSFKLYKHMNTFLAEVNKVLAAMVAIDGVAPSPPKTLIQSLIPLMQGAYLFELDSVESAK
ncbi:hypothetical protein H2248_003089 [Termitomyces sp. 'cryptogamus']|nr:hypothetical protein H2248_003089 [Termitomyces sp. 'cryptogamus']